MDELRRINGGWLSKVERRLLDWLAPRVPGIVEPDHLTLLGLAGATLTLIGYALSRDAPIALGLVNLGLVVNWFGDSLDGGIARLRSMTRPRYGFYLDQCVDLLAQAVFSLGLGISGYLRPEVVAIGFAIYLMMTSQSLLHAHATGDFHLAAAGIGLTETRCLFIAVNTAFYLWPPMISNCGTFRLAYSDVLGLLWSAINLVLFLRAMMKTLHGLAKDDPIPRPNSDYKQRS